MLEKPTLWLEADAQQARYQCCWPDLGRKRQPCTRPVAYVGATVKRLTSSERLVRSTTFGLCKPHFGKRNA